MIDVCLILEGTYPYVSGGVSSWVHTLIPSLPNLSFSILHLSPKRESYREFKYTLPFNVRELREIYILDQHFSALGKTKQVKNLAQEVALIQEVYEEIKKENWQTIDKVAGLFGKGKEQISPQDLVTSEEVFSLLVEFYQKLPIKVSFLDYFWTNFFMHVPLLNILSAELPKARTYHVVSTGYAGFTAALAKIRHQVPVLLTEHGIYTREREIEIDQSKWIYEPAESTWRVSKSRSFFRGWWISFFQTLAKITYHYADEITTIYSGNQKYQLADGASSDKMRVIYNGIRTKDLPFQPKTPAKEEGRPLGIGFVGRVVPIKDVKTFIRALKILQRREVSFEAYIIGPTDEDPLYNQECQELSKLLALDDCLRFTGKQKIQDYFPHLDVVVLTSISEGQPLVVLEANSAGIPVVATEVGACCELLKGKEEKDRQLGPSGLITKIAHPEETADAIYELWKDPELYRKMAQSGGKRVRDFYDIQIMKKSYEELYLSYI